MYYMDCPIYEELIYAIPPELHAKEALAHVLKDHPQIHFVSLFGVDIAGNDIDEKIPISLFLEDIEAFLDGGVTTDGSSVTLPIIASINDAKVDLVADRGVNWYVDYNFENLDRVSGLPWGTLRIPAFLEHQGRRVCSRGLLERALSNLDNQVKAEIKAHPEVFKPYGICSDELVSIDLTAATELEFWVHTPDDIVSREKLSTSQNLKEQYWKRTEAVVRTALEKTLRLMELYGFCPEMGHKEVGGVKAHLTGTGVMDHVLEQLEIDWKYAGGMQAADNELVIRTLIHEVFRLHGLEVSFLAKPIQGVAGSGEHTHVNLTAKLKSGRKINLFSPSDFSKDYLSECGWGALMGICKHYRDLAAPFITATNDAFRRLSPGFEAPTHICVSMGNSKTSPTRNRTVLMCLVRNPESPASTRFEVRSPNPLSNIYFVISALAQCMLDGISYACDGTHSLEDLEKEFFKKAGEKAQYLRNEYEYQCEEDIFTHYNEQERDRLFGRPAASVYETLTHLVHSSELEILYDGKVFTEQMIHSYIKAMLDLWELELRDRTLDMNLERVRALSFLGAENSYDEALWQEISSLRQRLAKNGESEDCLFERIRSALDTKDVRQAAGLQQEMVSLMEEMEELYERYQRNILELSNTAKF